MHIYERVSMYDECVFVRVCVYKCTGVSDPNKMKRAVWTPDEQAPVSTVS